MFEDILVLDCQTTGANPTSGQIIELAWSRLEGPLRSTLMWVEDEDDFPRRIARLTGLTFEELNRAPDWTEVAALLQKDLTKGTILLAHFARFEQPFMLDLLPKTADMPWLCTHKVAQRLLPDLPSKGLKALAGYFGHPVHEIKRAAEHVEATVAVWQGLQPLLHERGLKDYQAIATWLATSKAPRRQKLAYRIEREKRLGLAAQPGVYRFLNEAGQILYVGKATSLKTRVNSYFKGKRNIGPRHGEFLTQAVDIHVTETATPLEAALLETDEIKDHNPAYNRALKASDRQLIYCCADFKELSPEPNHHCFVGPFNGVSNFELLHSLSLCLTGLLEDSSLPRDITEEPICSDALQLFKAEHFADADPSPKGLLVLGMWLLRQKLYQQRLEEALKAEADREEAEELEENPEDPEDPEDLEEEDDTWDQDDYLRFFRSICRGFARSYCRSRSIGALGDCLLQWQYGRSKRWLQVSQGALVYQGMEQPEALVWDRSRFLSIDSVKEYDRLSVLRAEVKRVQKKQKLLHLSGRAACFWLRG